MNFQPTPTQIEARDRREKFNRTIQKIAADLARPKPAPAVAVPALPAEPPQAAFVPAYPSIDSIKKAVCEFYGISSIHLVATRRTKAIVEARHMAMYLCRELTPHSYPLIGKFLGGLDHTSVMHGFRKVENLMLTRSDEGANKAFEVATLLERLTGVKS